MKILQTILGLIGAIPGTFWGVVFGSLFSVSGVMLTNRANARRMATQFAHERELRINEREHTMRRDVYLAAAEALASCIGSLGQFVNLNIPTEDAGKAITEKMPLLAKVHMIGGQNVMEGIISTTTEIGIIIQNLSARRIPLNAMKQQIDALDVQLRRWGSDKDKSVELMKSHNLSGVVDQKRWDTISNQYEFESKQFNMTLENRVALQRSLLERQLEYGRDCIAMIHALRPLVVPVVVNLRRELGLPLDEDAFTKATLDASQRQIAALESFVGEVRKQVSTPLPTGTMKPGV
jgi:hypothetical protein